MDDEDSIFEELKIETDDPDFFKRVYYRIAKTLKKINAKKGDNLLRVVSEEYGELSRRIDRSLFQESCSVRNNLRTRRLANLLISDDGELNGAALPKLIQLMKDYCYSLGPGGQHDAPRNEHALRLIEKLAVDKNLQRQLKMISKPMANPIADQIIRDTLQLPSNQTITDAYTRRAALSALLCYLRQNVGSCFATAPAILVQREQPEIFLKDISELLGTGRMKRTFGGVEYAVPLTTSWGVGDFRKYVSVDRFDEKAVSDLGLSPGIMAALEGVKIIDKEKPLKDRVEETRKLVAEAIEALYPKETHQILVSAEKIVQFLLMRHLHITEKDLLEFLNRPKTMVQTSIFMSHPTSGAGMGGKGEASSTFLAEIKNAETTFNALSDNALLKSWEFTLASFAETKPGFTRWNMYSSLGFDHQQAGGIADCLYQEIKRKLDESNAKVRDLQFEYETVYSQLKYIEGRMRNVSSEKEAQWVKIEYESKRGEFRTLEEMRDREHYKAERFANLINDLLGTYDEMFPRYFQEVYDAGMHEITAGPYDDSPAGFRLLYKHGRANTSQWTLIYTPQEFIEALSSFFVATETEIVNDSAYEGLQGEISDLITRLVTHVKTDEFLISAFNRMAIAHNTPIIKDPLEHLDQIEKKPWAYTSGGTMHNLMSCYFRIEGKPKEAERWVENELELLVFFIDTLKLLPPKVLDEYLNGENRNLLMHSPTHAFSLRPNFTVFKEAVQAEGFSYTWVRDHLVKKAERFVEYLFMDPDAIQFLLEKLKNLVPANYRPRFQTLFHDIIGKKNPPEFRRSLVFAMENDPGLQYRGNIVLDRDVIDSALFHWLPLFSYQELKNRSEKLLMHLPGLTDQNRNDILLLLDKIVSNWGPSPFVTANQLQNICKAVLAMALQASSTSYNYPLLMSITAQKLGYAMPAPVLFADTNWVKDWFSFLINPGTASFELWRTDLLGTEGMPMSMWQQWLNGSNRERTWGIFTNPYEYKL